MELRQLVYLVAVAEEASFTRAAARVHISQSGVSAQIRQLERELGATLIDRTSRTATLTPAGEAVIDHARAALAGAASVRQAARDVTGLVSGRLALGMVVGCTVQPWFDALAAFRAEHPGVDLELTEAGSDQLIAAVRAAELDLALVAYAGEPPDGVAALPIVVEGLAAMVPAAGHPLAGRKRATLEEVCAFPLVTLPPGTGVRTALTRDAAAAHLDPDIALQVSAPGAVADLAERGAAVGVLTQSMAAFYADRLQPVRITGAPTQSTLAVIRRATEAHPAAAAFERHARAAFELD